MEFATKVSAHFSNLASKPELSKDELQVTRALYNLRELLGFEFGIWTARLRDNRADFDWGAFHAAMDAHDMIFSLIYEHAHPITDYLDGMRSIIGHRRNTTFREERIRGYCMAAVTVNMEVKKIREQESIDQVVIAIKSLGGEFRTNEQIKAYFKKNRSSQLSIDVMDDSIEFMRSSINENCSVLDTFKDIYRLLSG